MQQGCRFVEVTGEALVQFWSRRDNWGAHRRYWRVAIAAIGGHRPGGSPETIAGPEQQSVAGSRISVFQIARRMKQGGGTDRTWTSGGSGPSVENKKAQPLQMVRL